MLAARRSLLSVAVSRARQYRLQASCSSSSPQAPARPPPAQRPCASAAWASSASSLTTTTATRSSGSGITTHRGPLGTGGHRRSRAMATTANGAAAANGAPTPAGPPSSPLLDAIDGPDDSLWRPHALDGDDRDDDWVQRLDLDGATAFDPDGDAKEANPPRYLVLYGSLRERSYSRLLAFEFARLLERMGGRVRVFDPRGLPVQGSVDPLADAKVQELRRLCIWAQGYVWVSPEQHGAITAVFKNQIDWVPLSLGSVRPTQGRTLAVAQVCGGSQSFNAVNTLRLLGRWMRCLVIPNQSSIPKAWTEFDAPGRLLDSDYRARVVDVAEELHKFTLLTRGRAEFLVDRYSERKEKAEKGRLLSQAEKEAEKRKAAAAAT